MFEIHEEKTLISYKRIQRIEQFMFRQDAFREILFIAIVHKDYSSCNLIQISVYEDKIYICNDGEMPEKLDSTDKLFMKHFSKSYNPKLTNVFFMNGMIEAWGRGFEKIIEACAKYDASLLEYNISASGFMVLRKACDKYLELLRDDGHYDQTGYDMTMKNLDFCKEVRSVPEIMDKFGFDSRTSFRRKYLNVLVKDGKLTLPDKPKSKI